MARKRTPRPLWAKVREDLPEDPRIRGMARRLKISRDSVLGKIIRLWIWVNKHGRAVTPDSVTEHVDALFVDEFTEQSGFSAALAEVGWLRICEPPEGGLIWPNFAEWNSLNKDANELAKDRMRKKREKDRELLRNIAQHERNGCATVTGVDIDIDRDNTPLPPFEGGEGVVAALVEKTEEPPPPCAAPSPVALPEPSCATRNSSRRPLMPADNPELWTVAKRVVERYRKVVGSAHLPGNAISLAMTLLDAGRSEEELSRCVDGYGTFCRKQKTEPNKRQSAKSFFAEDGNWQHFLDGQPEVGPVREPARAVAVADPLAGKPQLTEVVSILEIGRRREQEEEFVAPRTGRRFVTQDRLYSLLSTEQAVLSAALRYPSALPEVSGTLRKEDFREYAHQVIYQALLDRQAEGKPIDLVVIAEMLKQRNQLEDCGGPAGLAKLWDVTGAGANIAYYADLVREASVLRQLHQAGGEIAADAARACSSAAEQIQSAESKIFAVAQIGVQGSALSLSHVIGEAYARIDARQRRAEILSGLPSGFDTLDGMTGGWQRGELILLAARPSVGKTALALALAATAASQAGIFFASLEQARTELAERLLCARSGVSQHSIRRGRIDEDELGRFVAAGDELRGLPFWIDDAPGQSVLRIASNARRLALRPVDKDINGRVIPALGLVLVDYLQLIEPEDRKETRADQLGGISRRLKCLARELNLPVIALSQLNREVEGRGDGAPRLSDLRGSGALEQDADMVILMHRPEKEGDELILNVAKQRNGPTGEIPLRYERARMRFEEAGAYSAFE